ncbi:unnamed protein product [Fraxinus pennsylvanica]|uniref:2-oxoacid dehydrogenase acyltransferase catalytic domain-containing protein n=1 Tax=Fraxinus pennsylvanica TaxID=56036 RepID=A0AAD1ZLC8_9LAMI|nr:unnamed protein product [Fraxinus pennsylvanica]
MERDFIGLSSNDSTIVVEKEIAKDGNDCRIPGLQRLCHVLVRKMEDARSPCSQQTQLLLVFLMSQGLGLYRLYLHRSPYLLHIRVDNLLELRSQLNAFQEGSSGKRISINDLVIKAAALALRKVP